MEIVANAILSAAERVSGRLGFVSNMIDRVVSRVAPEQSAKACYRAVFCGSVCRYTACQSYATNGYQRITTYGHWATGCGGQTWICYEACGSC